MQVARHGPYPWCSARRSEADYFLCRSASPQSKDLLIEFIRKALVGYRSFGQRGRPSGTVSGWRPQGCPQIFENRRSNRGLTCRWHRHRTPVRPHSGDSPLKMTPRGPCSGGRAMRPRGGSAAAPIAANSARVPRRRSDVRHSGRKASDMKATVRQRTPNTYSGHWDSFLANESRGDSQSNVRNEPPQTTTTHRLWVSTAADVCRGTPLRQRRTSSTPSRWRRSGRRSSRPACCGCRRRRDSAPAGRARRNCDGAPG